MSVAIGTIELASPAPMPLPRASRRRLPGLDVLRFFSVLLVLGAHLPDPPSSWTELSRSVVLTWKRGGDVGVDLFFVLSGFLVSGLLFGEFRSHGRISIERFYIRRAFKILPTFLVYVAACVAADLVAGNGVRINRVGAELLFVQSYFSGYWGHTWSLAVEEHFYLLLPLILYGCCRLNAASSEPLKPVLAVAMFAAVSCLACRLLNWHFRPTFRYLTHEFASHLRIDSLFCGVALSYFYHFHNGSLVKHLSSWRQWLIVAGIVMLSLAFVFSHSSPIGFTVGFTWFYMGGVALITGTVLCRVPNSILFVAPATLGSYSYSIYIFHLHVKDWLVTSVERIAGYPLGYGLSTTIYLVGSFIVGIAMSKLIEMPTLRIRDAWFPSRSDAIREAGPYMTTRGATDEFSSVS